MNHDKFAVFQVSGRNIELAAFGDQAAVCEFYDEHTAAGRVCVLARGDACGMRLLKASGCRVKDILVDDSRFRPMRGMFADAIRGVKATDAIPSYGK